MSKTHKKKLKTKKGGAFRETRGSEAAASRRAHARRMVHDPVYAAEQAAAKAAAKAAYERDLEEKAAVVRYYGDPGVAPLGSLIKRFTKKLPLDLYIEDKLILQFRDQYYKYIAKQIIGDNIKILADDPPPHTRRLPEDLDEDKLYEIIKNEYGGIRETIHGVPYEVGQLIEGNIRDNAAAVAAAAVATATLEHNSMKRD